MRSARPSFSSLPMGISIVMWTFIICYVSPEGTFKGRQELKRYFTCLLGQYSEMKLNETGLYVDGDVVAHEYVVEATTKAGEGSAPCMAILEIKDGKVQRIRNYYDRLGVARASLGSPYSNGNS
jgi:ketosteroid isomerase-like protein